MADIVRGFQTYFFEKMPLLYVFVRISGIQENAQEICIFNISDREAAGLRKAREQQRQTAIIDNLFKRLSYVLRPRLKCAVCVGNFPYECSGSVCGSASVLWVTSHLLYGTGLLVHDFEVPFCKQCQVHVANRAFTYTAEYKHAAYSPLHGMMS